MRRCLTEFLVRVVPDDALIAFDVGNSTYSFRRYFETKGQRVVISGYLGSMGSALPAAMDAWAATQDFEGFLCLKVTSVSGDGGFRQCVMEPTTLVKYGMDVTKVLLHNDDLGKISKEQRSGEWPVWETRWSTPCSRPLPSFAGRIAT